MRNSIPPITSIESFRMVTGGMKAGHHAKIMSAMRLLGVPCSMEEIAEKSGMDLAQVSRRVVELERDTIVFKNGKGRTSKGRPCFLYQLVRQTKGEQQQLF